MTNIKIPQGNDIVIGIYLTREYPFGLDNTVFLSAELDGPINTIECEMGRSVNEPEVMLIKVDGEVVDCGVYTIIIHAIVDGRNRKWKLKQKVEFVTNEDECNYHDFVNYTSHFDNGLEVFIVEDEEPNVLSFDGNSQDEDTIILDGMERN